jgi:hypothetical protein
MARRPPFAGLDPAPAPEAVVVEFGRPTGRALGCVGGTAVLVALVGLTALSYAATGRPGPAGTTGLRVVSGVVGLVLLAIVVVLVVLAARVVRQRQAVAIDPAGVWCQVDAGTALLPWAELADVRVADVRLEVCPLREDTVRGRPELAGLVTSGEPVPPATTPLRFAVRLDATANGPAISAAVDRWRVR